MIAIDVNVTWSKIKVKHIWLPLRDEIHNLRNFYETFMKIHDIFMTGSSRRFMNFIHEYIHKM